MNAMVENALRTALEKTMNNQQGNNLMTPDIKMQTQFPQEQGAMVGNALLQAINSALSKPPPSIEPQPEPDYGYEAAYPMGRDYAP